jgi:hypothetical protein
MRTGGVARVVVVADCQSEVFERGQRVAVFGITRTANVWWRDLPKEPVDGQLELPAP